MDFATWCDAVDASLKAQGKPFSTAQIDPTDLQVAFQNGQSPVIFARATAAPSYISPNRLSNPPVILLEPNIKMIRFLFYLFTVIGWLIWAAAAISVLLLGLVIVLTAASPNRQGSLRGSQDTATAILVGLGVPWVASWTLFLMLAGGVWHTIAQALILLFKVEQNTRNIP